MQSQVLASDPLLCEERHTQQANTLSGIKEVALFGSLNLALLFLFFSAAVPYHIRIITLNKCNKHTKKYHDLKQRVIEKLQTNYAHA